jgi:Ca2+/Na+ antiporter
MNDWYDRNFYKIHTITLGLGCALITFAIVAHYYSLVKLYIFLLVLNIMVMFLYPYARSVRERRESRPRETD